MCVGSESGYEFKNMDSDCAKRFGSFQIGKYIYIHHWLNLQVENMLKELTGNMTHTTAGTETARRSLFKDT